MRSRIRRNRIGLRIAIASFGLVGILALLLWIKTRLDREPTAEAMAAYSRGDWERTALLAQQRLKQVPGDPKALRLAFRSAARQDRDQRAIAIYSRLPASDQDPEDFFLVGQALSRTGQTESAIKALEAARTASPDHPETLDLLCRLYYQEARYYAAEEAAERLARQPDREARAQLMLGTARAELDDPAGVVTALRRWLELDPEGRLALPDTLRSYQLTLARALLKLRQPAERARPFKMSATRTPTPKCPGSSAGLICKRKIGAGRRPPGKRPCRTARAIRSNSSRPPSWARPAARNVTDRSMRPCSPAATPPLLPLRVT